MTLVERGGEVRSFHVKNATAKTLRETAVKVASRKSYLMTDENTAYTKLGKEFDGHGTVNHSADEYVRLGGFVHVNSAENYFSIFKRGVIGTFHHISEAAFRPLSLRNSISAITIVPGLVSKITNAQKKRSVARPVSGCSIKNLVQPRTLKQKARAFVRWRKRERNERG